MWMWQSASDHAIWMFVDDVRTYQNSFSVSSNFSAPMMSKLGMQLKFSPQLFYVAFLLRISWMLQLCNDIFSERCNQSVSKLIKVSWRETMFASLENILLSLESLLSVLVLSSEGQVGGGCYLSSVNQDDALSSISTSIPKCVKGLHMKRQNTITFLLYFHQQSHLCHNDLERLRPKLSLTFVPMVPMLYFQQAKLAWQALFSGFRLFL